MKSLFLALVAAITLTSFPIQALAQPASAPASQSASASQPAGDEAIETANRAIGSLLTGVANLERRNAKLEGEIKALKTRVAKLEEANRYKLGGIGLGALIPLNGGTGRFVIEGNLSWLYGAYYAGAGGTVGLSPPIKIGRVRLNPFGLGVYFGPALTVPEVSRSFDLTMRSAAAVRVWRGIEVQAEVSWYLPNPGAAAKGIKDAITNDVQNGVNQATGIAAAVDAKSDFDNIGNAYKKALKSPFLGLSARWDF